MFAMEDFLMFDDLLNDIEQCLYGMSAPVAPPAEVVIPAAPDSEFVIPVFATKHDEPQPSTHGVTKKYFCQVCNEPASKYSYGAMTCNACRQFFKRIISKNLVNKLQSCQNGGRCKVSIKSRNDCKKCRFDRCLYFGMRPELARRAKKVYDNKI